MLFYYFLLKVVLEKFVKGLSCTLLSYSTTIENCFAIFKLSFLYQQGTIEFLFLKSTLLINWLIVYVYFNDWVKIFYSVNSSNQIFEI